MCLLGTVPLGRLSPTSFGTEDQFPGRRIPVGQWMVVGDTPSAQSMVVCSYLAPVAGSLLPCRLTRGRAQVAMPLLWKAVNIGDVRCFALLCCAAQVPDGCRLPPAVGLRTPDLEDCFVIMMGGGRVGGAGTRGVRRWALRRLLRCSCRVGAAPMGLQGLKPSWLLGGNNE